MWQDMAKWRGHAMGISTRILSRLEAVHFGFYWCTYMHKSSRVWTTLCFAVIGKNGCGWDADTCRDAAAGGHLSCLQWARENGCDWDNETIYFADVFGHLSSLQWARENECDWSEDIYSAAARNDHLYILQWARDNGCPGADKYEHLLSR